jgi:hypothetical protein
MGTYDLHGERRCRKCDKRVQATEQPESALGSVDVSGVGVSTISDPPGLQIVRFVGLVSRTEHLGFSSNSTFDRKHAETKLRDRLLDRALSGLRASAVDLGANFIVGLQMQSVSGNIGGASMGTAAGRGDVVSLFLLGTAVVVDWSVRESEDS